MAAPLVVGKFTGSKPQGVRSAVVSALENANHDVLPESKDPAVDARADAVEFATVALDENLRGFVYGNTSLGMGSWKLVVEVRSGDTGELVGKRTFKAKSYDGLIKVIASDLADALSGSLKRAQAPKQEVESKPAAEEPKPERPPEPPTSAATADEEEAEPYFDADDDANLDDDEETSRPPATRRKGDPLPALLVALGPQFVQRDWALSDSLVGGNDGVISPTHVVPLIGIGATLEFYPGAFFGGGAAQYVGLEASFARSLVGSTDVPGDDKARETTFKTFAGALRGRIPLGDSFQLGPFVGYGRNDLILAGEKNVATQPDVKYAFIHAGADGRLALGKAFALDARLEYRHLLGFGDHAIRDLGGERWFPHVEGTGFAAKLGGTLQVGAGFGVRLGGTLTNYVMSFNPSVDDLADAAASGRRPPPIAGGASDIYYGADLSLTYALQP